MYIQDIKEIYESTLKGNYFLITTYTDYRKALSEENNTIKYTYLDRTNKAFLHQYQPLLDYINRSD